MKTAMIIQHQYQCHILGSPTFTMKGGHLDEKPRDPLCQDTLTLKTLSEERELNKPQATGCWKMPGCPRNSWPNRCVPGSQKVMSLTWLGI